MALPAAKSLSDCVDLEKAVWAYIPQLYGLPQQILQTIFNPHGLKALYVSTNPLISGFAFSLFLIPIFLILSEINKNYSQVDRLWSILPTIYNVHYATYAHAAGLPTARMDLLAAASITWSSRLTFNYWRKGGYQVGSEDYRWEILREKLGWILFSLLNVLFISSYQSVLLFLVTAPSYALLLSTRISSDAPTPADIGYAAGLFSLVAISAIADQQQWSYQNAKKEYQKTAKAPNGFKREDLDRGFLTSGLWAYSRHPNFAAEQSVWACLYLWASQITQSYYNFTAIGPFVYLTLFQGSTWFTEHLTGNKYPEYADYQKQVGMFVPGFGHEWSGPTKSNGKFSKAQEKKRK